MTSFQRKTMKKIFKHRKNKEQIGNDHNRGDIHTEAGVSLDKCKGCESVKFLEECGSICLSAGNKWISMFKF